MNMKQYVKSFFHRGLIFGGFGPIILGIVYAILESTLENFSLDGVQILIAIVSVYLLAFLQAGASVFNQIEHWGIGKSLLCHFSVLYIAYTICYLVNNWIPFHFQVLIAFTLIFVAVYLVIWFSVFISVMLVSRKLNNKFKKGL